MSIKITAIHEIDPKKGKIIRILGIEALEHKMLPSEYTDSSLCCYFYSGGPSFPDSIMVRKDGELCDDALRVGESYSPEEFEEKLQLLRECGDRLRAINEKNREEYRKWVEKGEHTWVI